MSNYTVFSPSEEPTPRDQLATHLAAVPMDIDVICLVTDLFERYIAKGIASRFTIRPFDSPARHPHGLLVGATGSIAVFWRASSGHFWLGLDELSFEHPAAILTGSRAPLIDKPHVGMCYRFSAGIFRTIAKPYSPCELTKQYCELIKTYPSMENKKQGAGSEDADGTSSGLNFRPASGFDFFKVGDI